MNYKEALRFLDEISVYGNILKSSRLETAWFWCVRRQRAQVL
jgi:hypothetical protein